MLANFLVPILEDGWRFIGLCAAATFLAALTGLAWLFWPLFVLTLWSIYFFRDPPRGVPLDDGSLVAPADGLVQMVTEAVPPAELGLGDQPLTRVSIFLSVFDVHINRTPCAGTIDVVAYRPGIFLNAAADKASEDNERMAITLKRTDGRTIAFVQIAGWWRGASSATSSRASRCRPASVSATSASAAAPPFICRPAHDCWSRPVSA